PSIHALPYLHTTRLLTVAQPPRSSVDIWTITWLCSGYRRYGVRAEIGVYWESQQEEELYEAMHATAYRPNPCPSAVEPGVGRFAADARERVPQPDAYR